MLCVCAPHVWTDRSVQAAIGMTSVEGGVKYVIHTEPGPGAVAPFPCRVNGEWLARFVCEMNEASAPHGAAQRLI